MTTPPARLTTFLAVLSCCCLASGQGYDQPLRPQFHFTAEKGWLNDPNGLVYYKGIYHLFFQHVPDSTRSVDEKTWGHATSSDLVHWKQLEEAIVPIPRPDGKLAGAWSGTAVVDEHNSAGFAKGGQDTPIVAFWTATGLGQCLACSTDAGRTLTMYAGNPVIPMDPPKRGDWDRDPDVFWYGPATHWVLIYSVSGKGFVFNSSDDLKHWTRQSLLPGMYECPNCFEIALDGDDHQKKWIVWDASGKYFIGSFDGRQFTPESGPFPVDGCRDFYAAQTWSNAPGGRRIAITWIRDGKFPGMPFNQQMGIPSELTLRTIPGIGPRLTKVPVKEIEQLRYNQKQIENTRLAADSANPLAGVEGDCLDLDTEIQPSPQSRLTFVFLGHSLVWADEKLTLGRTSLAAPLNAGKLKLRLLIDRTSIEAYVNDGATSLTAAISPSASPRQNSLSCTGEPATIESLNAWQMHSIWKP